jgi:hypothetical protein
MATRKPKTAETSTLTPAPEVRLGRKFRVSFIGRVYITAELTGGALNTKELYYMNSYDRRWLDQQAAKNAIDWEVDSVRVMYDVEEKPEEKSAT